MIVLDEGGVVLLAVAIILLAVVLVVEAPGEIGENSDPLFFPAGVCKNPRRLQLEKIKSY